MATRCWFVVRTIPMHDAAGITDSLNQLVEIQVHEAVPNDDRPKGNHNRTRSVPTYVPTHKLGKGAGSTDSFNSVIEVEVH